jgi:hypothetical protein
MSLHAVEAVEVRCDGCHERMEYGDEYCFWQKDQVGDWISECRWKEEDGKHYCCMENYPKGNAATCWPPSMRDEEEDGGEG